MAVLGIPCVLYLWTLQYLAFYYHLVGYSYFFGALLMLSVFYCDV